jgi:hypothetical protein
MARHNTQADYDRMAAQCEAQAASAQGQARIEFQARAATFRRLADACVRHRKTGGAHFQSEATRRQTHGKEKQAQSLD